LFFIKSAFLLTLVALAFGLLIAMFRHGPKKGFWITFEVIDEALKDFASLSLRRVWALSLLTLKESFRRYIWIVIILFAVFLLFVTWFSDTANRQPAQQLLGLMFFAINVLIMPLVVLLSVFTLPGEIKSRTIYNLVTKPVRSGEIVLGRILGFTIAGTILLVLMGLFSYVFVGRALSHSHTVASEDLEPIEDRALGSKKGTTPLNRPNQGHQHALRLGANGKGYTERVHGHRHGVISDNQNGDVKYLVGPAQGNLTAKMPIYGTLRFRGPDGNDTEKGVSVGNEWTYRSFIPGGTVAAAIWKFKDITHDQFPNGLNLEMTIRVFRTHKGEIEQGIPASIVLVKRQSEFEKGDTCPDCEGSGKSGRDHCTLCNGAGKLESQKEVDGANGKRPILLQSAERRFFVQDNILDAHRIPLELEDPQGEPIRLFGDGEKSLVNEDGELEIWIRCLDREQYLGMAKPDLYLHARDASYTMNFIKGSLGIWLQMILIISFGVMFSTLLSGPIAMMALMGSILMGFVTQFVVEIATGQVHGGGPIESFLRVLYQMNMVTELDLPYNIIVVVKWIDSFLLDIFSRVGHLLPDLRSYSFVDYVSQGFYIPMGMVLSRVVATLAYIFTAVIVGYFFLKTREVAR